MSINGFFNLLDHDRPFDWISRKSTFFQSATHWTTLSSPGRVTGSTLTGTWSSHSLTSSARQLATAPKIRTKVSTNFKDLPQSYQLPCCRHVSRNLRTRTAILSLQLWTLEGCGQSKVQLVFCLPSWTCPLVFSIHPPANLPWKSLKVEVN